MITIDYRSKTPLYEQIVERFQMLILKGILKPNEQLPSVRSLALKLAINPNTIQKAYTQLEQMGYIYPIKGRGNFVSGSDTLANEQRLKYFNDLKSLVTYGIDLGIHAEDCISFVKQLYLGGTT